MVRVARILSAIAAGVPGNRIAVGFGQTRTAKQLPVLTMECGYSRWLSGLLVPTRSAADFFTGWWQQIDALGAVPPTPSTACATRQATPAAGQDHHALALAEDEFGVRQSSLGPRGSG